MARATESSQPAWPRPLREGAKIAVVAPSSPFDVDAFHAGVAILRERYDVAVSVESLSRTGFLAGDDDRRAHELREALEDTSVEAIIGARGGHGATRLLGRIDAEVVRRAKKVLIGYSDLTALHALWARAGVPSWHATMVSGLSKQAPATRTHYFDALGGAHLDPLSGLAPIAPGRAEGRLHGGNLTVLTALLGTPYFPDLDGAIVFLEDTDERPYRVDRMLTTWHNAGAFRGVRAIALGTFTQCVPGPDGTTVEAVLSERLARLGIPVVAGVRAGHVDDALPLPLFADVTVDADRGTLTFGV